MSKMRQSFGLFDLRDTSKVKNVTITNLVPHCSDGTKITLCLASLHGNDHHLMQDHRFFFNSAQFIVILVIV